MHDFLATFLAVATAPTFLSRHCTPRRELMLRRFLSRHDGSTLSRFQSFMFSYACRVASADSLLS